MESKQFFNRRIVYNEKINEEMLEKVKKFYMCYILPELINHSKLDNEEYIKIYLKLLIIS